MKYQNKYVDVVLELTFLCNFLQMKDNWFTPEGLKSFCEKIEYLKENSDVDELL